MKTLTALAVLSFIVLLALGGMAFKIMENTAGNECKFDGMTIELPEELREVGPDSAHAAPLYGYHVGPKHVVIEMRNYK